MQNQDTTQNRFQLPLLKMNRIKHIFTIILSTLTIIGFGIRYKFGHHVSFWADEGQYLSLYKLDNLQGLIDYYWNNTSNDQPLLMYIVVYAWKSLVGTNPDQLRLLPLLISTAAIFATGHFCYRFSSSRTLSLIMAIFTMLSPFAIRYSYDLTSYCLVSLLAPISFFLFLDTLQKQNYFWPLQLLTTNILLLNTHYFSYFFVFSQGIIFLFLNFIHSRSHTLRKFSFGALVQIIFALVPFYLIFSKAHASAMQSWIAQSHPNIWNVVSQTFTFGDITRKMISGLIVILTIRFVSLFDTYEKKSRIILSCTILCFFLTLSSAYILQHFTWPFVGHPRYLMVTFPILFFFVIYSFQSQKAYWTVGFITTLFIACFAQDISEHQSFEIQDFRSASTYIEKKSIGNTSLVFSIPFKNVFEYYFSLDQQNIEISSFGLAETFIDPKKTDDFLTYLKNHSIKKIFLAHTFTSHRRNMIKFLLTEDFPKYFKQIEPVQHFKDIDIYEFEMK